MIPYIKNIFSAQTSPNTEQEEQSNLQVLATILTPKVIITALLVGGAVLVSAIIKYDFICIGAPSPQHWEVKVQNQLDSPQVEKNDESVSANSCSN